MRRNALVIASFLLLASLVLPFVYRWLAQYLDLPGAPATVLLFFEGLLTIAIAGLSFLVFNDPPERKEKEKEKQDLQVQEQSVDGRLQRPVPADPVLMRSAMGFILAAALFVTVFCVAMLSGALESQTAESTSAPASPRASFKPIVWTQYAIGDPPRIFARALIGSAANCPNMTVDGVTQPMRERRDPRDAIFGRMCEESISLHDKDRAIEIAYGGNVLLRQTVKRDPRTMIVMGDTGCRVATYIDQGCLSDTKWPFRLVSSSAARLSFDLIVHVGDYFYRETSCHRDSPDCHRRPFGDREESWMIDFFEPARDLMARQPWIFVRGNHEDCMRGGYGWFYYFGNSKKSCEVMHEATYLPFPAVDIVHFDTAHADDEHSPKVLQPAWKALAAGIVARIKPPDGDTGPAKPVLLLTHKPVYALCKDKVKGVSGCDLDRSGALTMARLGTVREIADAVQAAGRRTIVLGGDFHTFQVTDMMRTARSETVTQLIVGNGGSGLDSFASAGAPPKLATFTFQDYEFKEVASTDHKTDDWAHAPSGAPLTAITQSWPSFGFGLLEFGSRGGIDLAVYDPYGHRQFACELASARKAAATAVAPPTTPPASPFAPATPRCN